MELRKAKRNNKHWSTEEMDFIKAYYGKVKTNSLAKALFRSQNAVTNKCMDMGIKSQEHIYSNEPLTVSFKGEQHHLNCFRYNRVETGSVVDKTRNKWNKSSFIRPVKIIKEPMAAHRRKPEKKEKKPDLTVQQVEVKTFNQEDKKLVQIDKKTWVYR